MNKETNIGRTGFLFIVDSEGNLVVHKKAQGQNWINKPFIKYIANTKSGYHRYLSPKTKTYKVACYKYYEPKDWIIVASNFEADAAISEIATNVSQASTGIQEVNKNVNQSSAVSSEISRDIAVVSNSMNEMSTSSSQVNASAQELLKLSENLKGLVDQFKI